MRLALDSNILVYLAGLVRVEADREKIAAIKAFLQNLQEGTIFVVPVQVLGELFSVLKRSNVPPEQVREIVLDYENTFMTFPSGSSTLIDAVHLAIDHKLQFWDSLILTASAEAGCTLLLSEDLQNGFVTRGLTVVNPFAEKLHPRLARLLT